MEDLVNRFVALALDVAGRLLASVLVFVLGRILIKAVVKRLRSGKRAEKMDPTVARFLLHFTNVVLNVILAVTIVAIMGIPMASVVAAIASAGVAIGLALQGALGNLAGGIMILIFHPFRVGDFIEAAGFSGTVTDLDIFYTSMNTPDNRRITVPNGSVMGSVIINYSANERRRVDLTFSVASGTDAARVKTILLEEAEKHELVFREPEAFCRLSGQSENALQFTLRVWTKKDHYWQVYFDLFEAAHRRFREEGIDFPTQRFRILGGGA